MALVVLVRVCAGYWPSQASWLHLVSGLGWIMAFGGFSLVYGRLLLRSSVDKQSKG
jgi:uncharacterized protein involved in response to NO